MQPMQHSNFMFGVVGDQQREAHILEAIYRLRYQVYVEEWGFEKPEDHPGGLEIDVYDQHSLHVYACSGKRENIIGTARLILGSDLAFPIKLHFDIQDIPDEGSGTKVAEISRLSISKEYRRRAIDRVIFSLREGGSGNLDQPLAGLDAIGHERRKCEHELIRGLYLLIYRESIRLGLTHWYAVMARGLQVMLGRWGIPFKQIGPAREYHGVRAPFILRITELERSLKSVNPELLELARQVMDNKG